MNALTPRPDKRIGEISREALGPLGDHLLDNRTVYIIITDAKDGSWYLILQLFEDSSGNSLELTAEERLDPDTLIKDFPEVHLRAFLENGTGHDGCAWRDVLTSVAAEWVAQGCPDNIRFDRAGRNDDIVIGLSVAGRMVEVRIPPKDHNEWFKPLVD